MLDYSSCENYLKQLGYISSNDSIGATKIDYNPSTIYPQQSDIQASSTISFSLFTSDCKKVDLDLCKNLTTKIDIAISGNLTSLNLSQYDNSSYGNLFDPNNPYYNDRCLPIKLNDTKASILGRRNGFPNLTISCGSGCTFGGINSTTNYLRCICNMRQNQPDFGYEVISKFLDVISGINLLIITCYQITFTFVINLLNLA